MSVKCILMDQESDRIQPIELGGTSATTADEGRKNLGAAAIKYMTRAEYDSLSNVDSGTVYVITDQEPSSIDLTNAGGVLPVAKGGTGATDAANARVNLGLENVDNTSDTNKPVSIAMQAALDALSTRVQPISLGGTGAIASGPAIYNLIQGTVSVSSSNLANDDYIAFADTSNSVGYRISIKELMSYFSSNTSSEAVRIETGSYVGTGTYGESNPNTLTFGFEPKFLIVQLNKGVTLATGAGLMIWVYGAEKSANGSGYANFVTVDGTKISWYNVGNGSEQNYQCNISGETYRYLAIG